MEFLFIADGCAACKQVLVDRVKNYYPNLQVMTLRFNNKKTMVYNEKNQLVSESSPVSETPCLYLMETNELYSGQIAIYEKIGFLKNANE